MTSVTPLLARAYYQNTYLFQTTAAVIETGSNEKGNYFVANSTIFHPQGGGQPSDQGFVELAGKRFPILRLEEEKNTLNGKVFHFVDCNTSDWQGREVSMEIDQTSRQLFARLHTGGHLLSEIVEEEYPSLKASKGNHFPGGQAFVCFAMPKEFVLDKKAIEQTLNRRLQQAIAEKLPIAISEVDEKRHISIGSWQSRQCGGTHLQNLEQLQTCVIRSIGKQKNELKLGYTVAGDEKK